MPDTRPLIEARALLLQFQRSDLKAVHVATAWLEFFASRDPAWSARTRLVGAAAENNSRPMQTVRASHLGTVVETVPAGTWVGAGAVLARLRVLDRFTDVVAVADGTVLECHAAEGELVEYDQQLFAIA